MEFVLDGFADEGTLTFTATSAARSAATYLGGSGTWLGRQEGENLVLTIPAVAVQQEFRPAAEQEFTKAAAQARTDVLVSERISDRVRASSRISSRRAEVVVRAPVARTPRSVMQECSASMTTPAPRGWSAFAS